MTIVRHKPSKISSKCVEGGGLVFTTGIATDVSDDIKVQTQKILDDIDALLLAAGSNRSSYLYVQIWVTDISLRDAMNEVWMAWVDKNNLPARACVDPGSPILNLVEIQVTALKVSGT